MFDFTLFYLEFDPTIGPKIERSQSSTNNINLEYSADVRKSYSLFASFPKLTDFICSEPIRLTRRASSKFDSVSDKMAKIVLNNAFPESIKQMTTSEPHFFTFTFNQDQFANNINDSHFCYAIYMSVPDKQMIRKYHQFSYVIVTKLNNPSLFKELLISTFDSFRISSQDQENESFEDQISQCTYEIFDVLFSFLKQWRETISLSIQDQLQRKINKDIQSEKIDLPLIDGSLKAKLVRVNSKKFEIYQTQKDNSIIKALNLDKIKILDQSNHNNTSLYYETLKLIWESLVFNKNILILGATPDEASEAVFAFSSLVKEIKSYIIPYISVTDERFMQLFKTTLFRNRFPIIVGVSNPISEFFIDNNSKNSKSFFDFVYYVGFEDKFGFRELMSDSKLIKASLSENNFEISQASDNYSIMKKFDTCTAKFLKVINQSLIEMSKNDFSSLFIGQINVTLLSKELINSKIRISNYMKNQIENFIHTNQPNKKVYDVFAEQLINTQLFMNERKHFFYFSEISQNSLVDENVVNGMINMIEDNDTSSKKIIDKFDSDFCSSGSEDNEPDTKNITGNKQMAKKVLNIYVHALKNSANDDLKRKLRKALKEITHYTSIVSH